MHITEKNKMNSEKKIITAVIILLFLSFVFIAYSEKKQTDPNGKNDWWAIYFENPKSQDLSFTIENNGKVKKFHWKEIEESTNSILKEADVSIPAGQKNIIPLSSADTPKGQKIIIEVSSGAIEKKEIYKYID